MTAAVLRLRGALDPRPTPYTPRELDAMRMEGCTHVVQIAEPSLDVVHPARRLEGMVLESHPFPDVFTHSVEQAVYVSDTSLSDRRAFMRAVRAVEGFVASGGRIAVLGPVAAAAAVVGALAARHHGDAAEAEVLVANAWPHLPSTPLARQAARWALTLPS